MSVNSVAVLRLTGKVGGASPAGVVRGRGATRGGRGKNQEPFKNGNKGTSVILLEEGNHVRQTPALMQQAVMANS